MIRTRHYRWAPLILGICIACRSPAITAPQGASDASQAFRRAFEDSARANRVIGAQLAISIPGRPLLSYEFGVERSGIPMTSSVLLGTGSISKMIAAVAVLRLIDRGRLTLTDTVGRWLPSVSGIAPGISLRSLLWHQSGLAEYGSAPGYAAMITQNPQREWQPEELLSLVGAPVFPEGTRWAASNTDRMLLALIASRMTQQPYGEHLAQQLFNSGEGGYWTPGQLSPAKYRISTHWGRDNAGNTFDYSATFFGPSLFTSRLETYLTARETALFVRRLFDGDLLSPSGRELLMTIVPDDGRIAGQTGGGVGIRRFSYFGRTFFGNSGATGNSSAMYLYDPETKVIVAMSTNQEGGTHGNSHFRTVPALMQLANQYAVTK